MGVQPLFYVIQIFVTMKQKQDGKGQPVLTDHAKTDPKNLLKKLIRRSADRAFKTFQQQVDK